MRGRRGGGHKESDTTERLSLSRPATWSTLCKLWWLLLLLNNKNNITFSVCDLLLIDTSSISYNFRTVSIKRFYWFVVSRDRLRVCLSFLQASTKASSKQKGILLLVRSVLQAHVSFHSWLLLLLLFSHRIPSSSSWKTLVLRRACCSAASAMMPPGPEGLCIFRVSWGMTPGQRSYQKVPPQDLQCTWSSFQRADNLSTQWGTMCSTIATFIFYTPF